MNGLELGGRPPVCVDGQDVAVQEVHNNLFRNIHISGTRASVRRDLMAAVGRVASLEVLLDQARAPRGGH